MKIKLVIEGEVYDSLLIIVRGDFDGNGYVSVSDYAYLKNNILLSSETEFVEFLVSNVRRYILINVYDLAKTKNYVLSDIDTLNGDE